MKLRKCAICVLALILMLGILCVTATATEQQSQPKSNTAQLPFQVNPVYEDLYNAEDLAFLLDAARENAAEESSKVSHQMPTLQTGREAYLSKEQAAQHLRDQMEARKQYIEVYVSAPTSDYNTLIAQVVDIALLHTGDPTEGDYLRWHFGGWEGEVEWDRSGEEYLYKYELTMLYYTTAQQEQKLDIAVNNLIATLDLNGKRDYEKVYAVYDYICDNITYDNAHLYDDTYTLKNSAYAALINKTAVCQGYANLFYRLMLEMGIDCRLIAGDANGPHAWNIVKLGSVYYNLDSTWDAGTDLWEYFLQNSEGFADHYRYMDYATAQFHADYPMSATDYVDGVDGQPENIYVAGVCGYDAYWTLGRDRVLTIIGTGETYDYKYDLTFEERPDWIYWKNDFDTIVVEEGITGLGENVFAGMESIQKVVLPEGLKTIQMQAFKECKQLSDITLPKSLEKIEARAFEHCNLKEITIPEKVTTINGFGYNLNLTAVHILAQEIKFGDEAFIHCISLSDMEIPQGTTWIGIDAFLGCNSLETITIPDSVQEIGISAFSACNGLEKVIFNSDCNIGMMAFKDCKNLKELVFNGETQEIMSSAFNGCVALKEVTFPASVISLGYDSFQKCTALEKIVFCADAPGIAFDTFSDVTATAYYPMNNPTWTEDVLKNYNGNITWVPYCNHDYETVSTMASCIHNNETVYTCTKCGDTYREIFRYATGQHTFTDDQDTICDVCGGKRDLNMPTTPMYRLYNQNSGEHFYTGSVQERDMLIGAGWQYEGIAWNAPIKYGTPVYRLYNPNSGDHHYTMSAEERDMLVDVGWKYEGIAWNSASSSKIPMYRLYNPNADCGSHHYTGSEEERDYLVSLGWHYEGIGWYGLRN